MLISTIDPCSDPRWKHLAETHEHRSVFLSPAWLQVIRDTYDFTVKACILTEENDQAIAGIPYCEIEDLFGGRRVVFPFCDYCDPLVANISEWRSLIDHVPLGQVLKVRTLKNDVPLQDDRFDLLWKAKWHGLDIRASFDDLMSAIDGSARRGINKSLREGMVVTPISSVKDLRRFYNLHLGIRKNKYRLLAQPYEFFLNIWHQIIQQGQGVILKAEFENQMVGAAMFLNWADTTYYKISASDTGYKKLRISEVLIWEGVKYAKSVGRHFLDLGLSDWDQEGLIGFKRKFADAEETIHQLVYVDSPDTSPGQNQKLRSTLPKLTNLFTNALMPDRLTEMAGNFLYRYFT